MKKNRYYKAMLLLLCAAIAATVLLFVRMHQFTRIVYAAEDKPAEELSDELYYDSLELLAICVQAEAGNQPLLGRRMVADVILNRVDDPDFPDTIEGVITQKYHFTSYWDGGMDKVVEPDKLTILAVQMELERRSYPGLFYFSADGYSRYGTPWGKVGDHYFSTK